MDYKIYPFVRKDKIRLYVVFFGEYGQRIERSTGITCPRNATKHAIELAKKRAVEPAEQKVREYLKGESANARPKFIRLTPYLMQEYYPFLQTNRSKGTLVSYRNALTHFIRICGNKAMIAYDLRDINRYKSTRYSKEHIKKTTINIELRAIKAAFSWAWRHDFIDRHPYKGQGFLFDAKSKRRAFNKKEIRRLFNVSKGSMAGLAIQLSYYTGMRIGELSNTTWSMVNMDNRFIELPSEITKNSNRRVIPLSPTAFNIIKILEAQLRKKIKDLPHWYNDKTFDECHLLQKERGYGRYEARSIQDRFRDLMNEANLPKELTFHCLRHSFATHVLENGGNIYAVSKIMGHSTPNITSEFYDHTTALAYRDEVNRLVDF